MVLSTLYNVAVNYRSSARTVWTVTMNVYNLAGGLKASNTELKVIFMELSLSLASINAPPEDSVCVKLNLHLSLYLCST